MGDQLVAGEGEGGARRQHCRISSVSRGGEQSGKNSAERPDKKFAKCTLVATNRCVSARPAEHRRSAPVSAAQLRSHWSGRRRDRGRGGGDTAAGAGPDI